MVKNKKEEKTSNLGGVWTLREYSFYKRSVIFLSYQRLKNELNLKYPAFGISRIKFYDVTTDKKYPCVYKLFDSVLEKGTLYLTAQNLACKGAATGCGFHDGIPDIPGGFGHFISHGRGEGFPAGECIKCSPELAEKMLLAQPQNVMGDCNAIKLEVFEENTKPELITFLVTPDQLSGLLHLFYYRRQSYDNVIVPVSSGCAQLFRLPFGELAKEDPKAVIGNIDFFSRPHLDEALLAFTVSFSDFKQMCHDVPESCLYSPAWCGVKKRL